MRSYRCGGYVLFALAVVVVSGIAASVPGLSGGRTLTNAQMEAVFGDGTSPCVKSYPCNQGFVDGTSNCAICLDDDSRTVCCDLGDETTCEYKHVDDDSLACHNAVRQVGPRSGLPGTCGTCTSSSYIGGGLCITLLHGTGGNCP